LFIKLPRTGAILFGIRLNQYPLSELIRDPNIAARLARALESMPDEVAAYKGVAPARAALLEQLNAVKLATHRPGIP
jgi:hypothetical protein